MLGRKLLQNFISQCGGAFESSRKFSDDIQLNIGIVRTSSFAFDFEVFFKRNQPSSDAQLDQDEYCEAHEEMVHSVRKIGSNLQDCPGNQQTCHEADDGSIEPQVRGEESSVDLKKSLGSLVYFRLLSLTFRIATRRKTFTTE